MENRWRRGKLLALYLPLIAISIIRLTTGKELRPSNHGLTNNTDAPETATPPQMSSFFGGGVSSTIEPLPEARNFSDSSSNGRRTGGTDQAKKVLMVSSLVCGSAGVALLAVVGFLFLQRYRNRRSVTVLSS